MGTKQKVKTVASQVPLLYVYAGLFFTLILLNLLRVQQDKLELLTHFSNLGVSDTESKVLLAISLSIVYVPFSAALYFLVTSHDVRKVRKVLKVLLGFMLFALLFALGTANIYSIAFVLVEVGFTYYTLKLTSHLKPHNQKS